MVEPARLLVDEIRGVLAQAADPAKAAPMQAYMKSALPFHGVQKPARVAAVRPVFKAQTLPDRTAWENAIRTLWDSADYREERYAATDLARHRRYLPWSTAITSLPLYDHLIVTGAWWDHVDEIAARLVGPVLRAHSDDVTPTILRWARDSDRWRRRAAVICQLGSRTATDTELLADCVLANAADPDFFIRKGIGWALREYAKTDPGWVHELIDANRARLSPLSVREATRNLKPRPTKLLTSSNSRYS